MKREFDLRELDRSIDNNTLFNALYGNLYAANRNGEFWWFYSGANVLDPDHKNYCKTLDELKDYVRYHLRNQHQSIQGKHTVIPPIEEFSNLNFPYIYIAEDGYGGFRVRATCKVLNVWVTLFETAYPEEAYLYALDLHENNERFNQNRKEKGQNK